MQLPYEKLFTSVGKPILSTPLGQSKDHFIVVTDSYSHGVDFGHIGTFNVADLIDARVTEVSVIFDGHLFTVNTVYVRRDK